MYEWTYTLGGFKLYVWLYFFYLLEVELDENGVSLCKLHLVSFAPCLDKNLEGNERREGEGRGGNNKKSFIVRFSGKRREWKSNIFSPNLSTFGEIWLSTKLGKLILSNPFHLNSSPSILLSKQRKLYSF